MKTKTGKGTENKTDIESILKELTGDGIKGCYLLYGEDEYTRRKEGLKEPSWTRHPR